mgnify:CR=1 FL=1
MFKTADLSNEIIQLDKELILVDNINYPFASLMLQKRSTPASSVIVNWKYEKLNTTNDPAFEGAEVDAFLKSDRSTGDKNVCQIFNKAVAVSGTADAVSLENIRDLFSHEIENRLIEAKRDLEHYLLNGAYQEETTTKARQMQGLLGFIKGDNAMTDTKVELATLQEMAKAMRKAGTSSQNLMLICDYNMTDAINTFFDDKQRYIVIDNEFGNPVKKVNLTYGSAFVYTLDSMPEDTMALVNLDFLGLAELRKMQYHDLAKSGDSRKGFVVCENTLKFLHATAGVKFTKTA